ncbi:MAG: benzoate/H(+) symporter BenE family transporter, partial [Burkholderiales bacterium]|nr:benzoate/H(+) symporter BenE family transporter [Burkholderiales bacterium]
MARKTLCQHASQCGGCGRVPESAGQPCGGVGLQGGDLNGARRSWTQVFRDTSLTAVSAGFVATLVGFSSTIALIFHAARSLGASPDQITSWVLALGVGMGLSTIGLSLWMRIPVLITWSTPGAAVIASAAAGVSLAEATGAFLVCGVLMWLCGVTGWFERVMSRIPVALASALLAGILAKFALMAFASATPQPAL